MYLRPVLSAAAAALACLAAGCSAPEGAEERPGPTHQSEVAERQEPEPAAIDYRRLDARLRTLMEEPHMVGLAVGVVEGGEIRFLKGYGETFHDGGEPVGPDTVFRWASLSKGVAADLVALLAAEGQLSLSDAAGRHAPSLRLPRGDERKASVADVLSHRLGLFGHAYDSRLEDGDDPKLLRGMLAGLDPICPPSTCHAYQNVAYDAASEIVEQVTGESYARALEDRFFRPLGMTRSSTSLAGLIGARSWARPHVGGASPDVVEEIKPAYYRVPAAGGVNGSIKDLALWMRAQMGLRPQVLPARVLETVQTPRVATPRENVRRRDVAERLSDARYGLGWRIFDYAGHRVIGHHGGVRGYRALILFDPVRQAGVVALWNSSTSQPNGLEYEVLDMLYDLPFRDWLEIGEGAPDQPEEAEPEANEGG